MLKHGKKNNKIKSLFIFYIIAGNDMLPLDILNFIKFYCSSFLLIVEDWIRFATTVLVEHFLSIKKGQKCRCV